MVEKKPPFDVETAHKYFSAHCFNTAWGLIDKKDRNCEEDEEMIRLSLASIWHWTQRPDCTNQNLSIGYWQASRVYALVEQVENARRYAKLCLDASKDEEPFYLGYAYEALARAESLAKDGDKKDEYLAEAQSLAKTVTDAEAKELLLNDLKTIK